jgi:meso-butanediol dehydrogenase / (S,S)-butanediol dehydrogenase / diacetyl reductase
MGIQDGRVAVITGAGSGIGRAAAERFVADGGAVVGVDVTSEALAWFDAHPNAPRMNALVGDVRSAEVNDAAVDLAVQRFGRLDAIVLNAGVAKSGDVLAQPIEDFDLTMDVNVRGVVLGVRAAVPVMRNLGGGSIVVTASVSGLGGDPNMWAYNASKGAVVNLVRSLAQDLGMDNIRVNAVCPGPTETGMTTRIKRVPPMYDALRERIPLNRWGLATEVAAVINFLSSTDASFVNGAVIPVDGGVSANSGQFRPRKP